MSWIVENFLRASEERLVHVRLHLPTKITWRDWSPRAAAKQTWACLSCSLVVFSLPSKCLHSESYAAIATPSVRRHKKICESVLKFFTFRSTNDVAVHVRLWKQRLAQTAQISRIFWQAGWPPASKQRIWLCTCYFCHNGESNIKQIWLWILTTMFVDSSNRLAQNVQCENEGSAMISLSLIFWLQQANLPAKKICFATTTIRFRLSFS